MYATAYAFWMMSTKAFCVPDTERQGIFLPDDECQGICLLDTACQGKPSDA